MRILSLLRHGETDWNAQQRFQGHVDIPLNDKGREQASLVAPKLQSYGIQAIVSSDLSRAKETAEIIAGILKVPVFHDARLREAHLGAAQGLTREEIVEKLGQTALMRWKSSDLSDADVSYPGGETGTQVLSRVFKALEDFSMAQPFKRIAVATHGGVIRRVINSLRPPNSGHVPIPNGVIYHLTYDLDKKNLQF